MGRRTIYLFVNGILTFPGLSKNWTRRAVTWTHTETPHRAESLEYLITALLRPFWQGYRARKLARKMDFYAAKGFDLVLVGHSNGADVISDALEVAKFGAWASIRQIHLFAPACAADFSRNCFNQVCANEALERLVIYTGGRDWALLLAATPVGRLLGYGTLGRVKAPEAIPHLSNTAARKVAVWHEPDYGHGGFFDPAHFKETMRGIMAEPYPRRRA